MALVNKLFCQFIGSSSCLTSPHVLGTVHSDHCDLPRGGYDPWFTDGFHQSSEDFLDVRLWRPERVGIPAALPGSPRLSHAAAARSSARVRGEGRMYQDPQ